MPDDMPEHVDLSHEFYDGMPGFRMEHDDRNLDRPAHTRLLDEGVLVVENLRDLDRLHGRRFRLYAIPIRAVDAVAMPVRAFADVE